MADNKTTTTVLCTFPTLFLIFLLLRNKGMIHYTCFSYNIEKKHSPSNEVLAIPALFFLSRNEKQSTVKERRKQVKIILGAAPGCGTTSTKAGRRYETSKNQQHARRHKTPTSRIRLAYKRTPASSSCDMDALHAHTHTMYILSYAHQPLKACYKSFYTPRSTRNAPRTVNPVRKLESTERRSMHPFLSFIPDTIDSYSTSYTCVDPVYVHVMCGREPAALD
ncbi:unnamed protein product [Ectocarpus sp. 12 AP-2014]